MKKFIFLGLVVMLVVASIRATQRNLTNKESRGQALPTILDGARVADGLYDLAKLVDEPRLPEERRAALAEADRDRDGLLTQAELDSAPDLASRWAEEAARKAAIERKEAEMTRLFVDAYYSAREPSYSTARFLAFEAMASKAREIASASLAKVARDKNEDDAPDAAFRRLARYANIEEEMRMRLYVAYGQSVGWNWREVDKFFDAPRELPNRSERESDAARILFADANAQASAKI